MNLPLPFTDPAAPAPTGAIRLADWGLIRARGADAAKFLHGQLTQDVELMGAGEGRLAGYCSVKGRLLATFVMWRDGADSVLLACSADVLAAVLKRLSMFVLRSQCKLTDATAEMPLWGLAGDVAQAGWPQGAWQRADLPRGTAVRLPDAAWAHGRVPRWLWAGEPPAGLAALDLDTWQGLEAASGVGRVVAATVEQFVPQMINLELVGGVNFKKGCYPGQEVVARSQYRGTLKRRGHLLRSTEPLRPGQEVFHDADPGQPAGMVVLAGHLPGVGPVALAELKLAATAGGSLHAGTAGGPLLTVHALPYALPQDAD